MKFGCSIAIFLNSAHLICRSVSEGLFDFEITRVDCSIRRSTRSTIQSMKTADLFLDDEDEGAINCSNLKFDISHSNFVYFENKVFIILCF